MENLLDAVANYGFPAVFCLLLYVDMRKVLGRNTQVIARLEVTQSRFIAKLDEKET